MRRFGAFFRTYLRKINGIQALPPEKSLGDPGYRSILHSQMI